MVTNMANTEENEEEPWNLKFREDEEMEFFTELALHETERWIQAVTKKKFAYPDDFRKSLENGVLLCELLNNLKPGAVKRINKLPGAIAGLDNINVFLKACRASFGLNDKHLFDPNDLEDLSQRAIADSDHLLKQEEDRRAVNVAITIYWLGRSVANSYSGAQLDISAFAALVHHNGKEIIPDDHFRHDSWETSDYNSSAYSSHENNSKVSLPDGTSYEQKHNRDSSYESYGSYSRGSESLDEDNMPVRRYGSASSLNRSGEQLRFSATSDIYSDGGQDSLYQSSPDLLHGTNNHHRRSSSTDSMDGSYHGSHSRQSSDSVENYPTRTLSTQRKTSTSTADPLQFIKLKPSNDLAKKAEAQIRATEALKTERVKAEKELEHDIPDDNWQSNLSSWKNRRRRQSAATYERVEGSVDGAETKSKEQEEKKKPKTYSQIMAERDKRKSTGTLNFYPIEDDDEPSWLTDAKSSRNTKAEEPERAVEPEPVITQRSVRTEYRAPPISSRSKSLSSLKQRPSSVGSEKLSTFDIDDTAVATWAEEQSDEESDNSQKKADEEEANNTDTKPQRNNDTNQNNQEEQQQVNNRLNDKNERFSSWNRKTESSLSDKSSSVYKNDKMDSGKTTSNKVSGLLKSFEKKDEDAKVSYEKPSRSFQFSATSDSSRRSEGFRNQKSKSFDTGTAGLTFSASPVKTEKIKSPVNAKPPVNPALLRKDTSPKQEAPEVKVSHIKCHFI
ncbi:hypothetical protein KUTeg_024752 [Tegillarca granosa]|uniref:Calponin-homology (CH) domain-containing protein n=1 Tax=Tegillarca granosa TaxID=220873 RepID=A0ABQ9DY92_TEGGR|nr:hypothetical protein KUTeg_024752 [Tegillarca granosa]